mmetsp:Transcript_60353/g.156650  ORF Transcript_60353/g.156650 Transcript_60353/m.156650 type:complete len:694 (-) Transcript_60353:41-2122(-)
MCDLCGAMGTQFACSADCNYDMCLACRNTQCGLPACTPANAGVASAGARALLPPALANLPVIQPPVRFNGVVKSFNELKGFGFISCAEMVEAHGCDVFLHKDQRKEWKPNDEVSFIVRLNRDGKPQAYDLNLPTGEIRPIDTVPIDARRRMQQRTLGPGIPDVKEELGRHCGIVRSFDQEVGYGFVLCPEIHDMGYLHDVFVHHMQIGIFEKGDMIEFDAYLNSKGLPQCHNLSACHGERLEQLQKQLDELEAKRQRKRSHRKGGGKADRRQGGPDDPPGGAEAGLAPEGESLIEFGENGAPRPKKHYSFLEASVCKDWLHGTCERGDRCRFKHETESGQPVSETPCWDFVNGNCDRGDRCKFSHTVPEGEGKKGRGRGKGKGSGDRGQPKEQEVCRHFLKGWCNFGSGCRYLHTEDSSSSGAWRPSLGPAGGDEGGWAGGREPGGGGQRWGGRRRDRWADDYYDRIDSGAKRGWKRRRESWSELPDADSPQDGAGPLCREGHRLICDRRPGAVCDECGAAGTRWSCSGGCNFDLCAGCASEADPVPRCPDGQVMKWDRQEETACSACGATGTHYATEGSSFALCLSCRNGQWDPGVLCSEGHPLKWQRRDEAICDLCHSSGTQYCCTRGCNYDLCARCRNREDDTALEETANGLPGRGTADDAAMLEDHAPPEDAAALPHEGAASASAEELS